MSQADSNNWLPGLIQRVGWELHLLASFAASLLLAVVQVCCTARDHEECKMNDPTGNLALCKQPKFDALSFDNRKYNLRH